MTRINPNRFSETIPLAEYHKLSDLTIEDRIKSKIDSAKEFVESKMGKDYYNSKLFFITQLVGESNKIEGIKPKEILEPNTREYFEVIDHIKAFEYVINNHDQHLSADNIKHIHRILMENIAELDSKKAGEYRETTSYMHSIEHDSKIGNYIDIHKFSGRLYYKQVRKAMKDLEDTTNYLDSERKTASKIWNVHNDFEIIHPFYDGNGRTGRLILNWLSLKYFGEFINVLPEKRHLYYDSIKEHEPKYRKDNPEFKFYKDKTVERLNFGYLTLLEDIKGIIVSNKDNL